MRKLSFPLLLFVFILFSCGKEMETRVIQGYIYKNCESPFNDLNLSIMGIKEVPFSSKMELLGDITTDKNGYYHLSYESTSKYDRIIFYEPSIGSSLSIIRVPYQDNLELFHYVDGRSTHKIHLKVTDTFNNKDTLYLGRRLSDTPFFVLPGPFENERNYKVKFGELREYSPWFELKSKDYSWEQDFVWAIGMAEYKEIYMHPERYPASFQNQILKDIRLPICGMGSELVIDLREK